MYMYHPNGRHFFVNLDKRPFRQSKITPVGSIFGPSKSTVVERNFRPFKITVVGQCFGPSKILVVDRTFRPFFFYMSKWLTYIRTFGPSSNWAVQNYSCGL